MKNRWLVFAIFLLSALIFYHQSLQVYFLSDDWRLFYLLHRYGFSAITFNFDSEFIRLIPCTLLSAFYFLFGISSAFPFHLLSIVSHALNAFLVFVLAEKIFSRYLKNADSFLYSLMAGIIFLALPYQVEAITWMSATSDLQACCFVLLSLIYYFDYKASSARKYLFLSFLFFLLAVLSKESSLFVPLLILAVEIFEGSKKTRVSQTVALYFVPFLVYAMVNKFLTGDFITPGISNLKDLSFALVVKNFFLYAAKFFALYRLLPSGVREILKYMLEHKAVVLPVIAAVVLLLYFLLRKKLSIKTSGGKLMALGLMALIISLLPVIPLETSFVGSSQSDRYSYLPSVFFVLLVAGTAALINRKGIMIACLCMVLVWFYGEVQAQSRNWVRASHMVKKILNEFKPADGVSYITNMPDNFNGAYILRNGLSEAVSVIHNEDFIDRINVISYQTITSEKDRAEANLVSDSVCRVTFAKPEVKIPRSEKIFTIIHDRRYSFSEVSDSSFIATVKRFPSNGTMYYYSEGSYNIVQ